MPLTPCADLSAAAWITGSDQPWRRLVTLGPPGFPAYARLRFLPDPAYEGQRENDVDDEDIDDTLSEEDQMRAVLETLARYTRTPQECYFCLWDGVGWTVRAREDGWTLEEDARIHTREEFDRTSIPPDALSSGDWTGAPFPESAAAAEPPEAPKVVLPHRAYFLFRGRVDELGDWDPAHVRPARTEVRLHVHEPALVWPADHAWFLANDIDPHWVGIGADAAAITELRADPRLDVVPADPREDQPAYR